MATPPMGKKALMPPVDAICLKACTVDAYSPVYSFCLTTSYGTLENDATVFPIAAEEAIAKVLAPVLERLNRERERELA